MTLSQNQGGFCFVVGVFVWYLCCLLVLVCFVLGWFPVAVFDCLLLFSDVFCKCGVILVFLFTAKSVNARNF